MPTEAGQTTTGGPRARLRRCLWDGVLPEALGLCFVALIFAGFTVAYLITDYSWDRHSMDTRRAEAELLAQSLATTLGALTDAGEEPAKSVLKGLLRAPRVRSVRWTGADGADKLVWPPVVATAAGVSLPSAELPDDEARLTSATAPVRRPSGEPAGTLRVETNTPTRVEYQGHLLWIWGIAAGITLLVFVAVYHRLRRHLRPVAAIERNLHSLASGIEQELMTLTLSDSLGTVARGWNRLIEQYAQLQRQQQIAGPGQVSDVLARFESATYRRVLDRLPGGVLCVSPDQNVSYANSAAGALLGHAPDELVGHPLSAALDDPAVLQAVLAAQTRGGAGLSIDQVRSSGEQEVNLRFRILALMDHAGGDTLVSVEDISHLREDQRARDNFLYHVTHELRTPLTNIHAYAETLTKPGFDDEQTRKECYNVIISETRRLSSLVENILSISQLEVGTARLDVGEVDLARLMRQVVQDNLGAADEKRIDLTLTLPPKVPKIRGDKQRLAVLLNNLIGNAVKYTPESGEVRVGLDWSEQRVRIAVNDNGIGIAPEDQAHVFEKFYRAADDKVQMMTGTGLGLAIAREVARLHGGEIYLESKPGSGSKFTIELPAPVAEHAEVGAR